MIQRHIYPIVRDALDRQAAVALIGPPQVGKTTLALEIAEARPLLYLDLESRGDRDKLADPALFLKQYEDRLVILDEIHRTPELFQTLRGLIDAGRRKGRRILSGPTWSGTCHSSARVSRRKPWNGYGPCSRMAREPC